MRRLEPRAVFVGVTLAALVLGIAASQIAPEIRKRQRAPIFTAEWTSLPTEEDIAAVYPEKARNVAFEGDVEVDMRCYVDKAFGIKGCSVVRERPTGYGFGEATLKLAPKFRLDAKISWGESLVGYRMIVPVQFQASTTPPPEVPGQ